LYPRNYSLTTYLGWVFPGLLLIIEKIHQIPIKLKSFIFFYYMKAMLPKKTFFIDDNWTKKKVTAHMLYFPNYVQPNPYSCWVASVLSILWYYGIEDKRERQLEKILKANPKEWTHVDAIVKFFTEQKFKTAAHKMTVADIEWYINTSIPVMVMIQARSDKKINYSKAWEEWHYVVVIWYNKDYLFFDDPVLENIWYLPKKEFESRRHDYDDQKHVYIHYGIAVYGKKPKYDTLLIKKID
jgi:hypothetical protein